MQSNGCGFNSWLFQFRVMSTGKLFTVTHMPLSPNSRIWYLSNDSDALWLGTLPWAWHICNVSLPHNLYWECNYLYLYNVNSLVSFKLKSELFASTYVTLDSSVPSQHSGLCFTQLTTLYKNE